MDGEFVTRATIWITLILYLSGVGLLAAAAGRAWSNSLTRVVWTIACFSLVLHFVSAFHFYHEWSHAAASRDTARQTYDVVGVASGVGVFVNYALLTVWVLDIAWWWLKGAASYFRRPRFLILAWHGFLVFVIFNATVVFGKGPARWVGLLITLMLLISWIFVARQIVSKRLDVTA
jgi:hypothetical protein